MEPRRAFIDKEREEPEGARARFDSLAIGSAPKHDAERLMKIANSEEAGSILFVA